MTALGMVTGSISLGVGSSAPVEVATFDLPIVAHLSRNGEGAVTLDATIGPESLSSAIAIALREAADHFDPETRELPEPELLPGAVVLHCPDCDATVVGSPGDMLEHAEDGAHVHSMTYGVDA